MQTQPAPSESNNTNDNMEEDKNSNGSISEMPDKGIGTFDPANFQVKHPLQNRWVWWYDNPGKKLLKPLGALISKPS